MIHIKTHKREIVDDLYELGLSISYNRVLNISNELGNMVCQHYRMERVLCLPALNGGYFTNGAVHNVDYDPSCTSAHDSFHGTRKSLCQHPDSNVSEVPWVIFAMPDDMDTKEAIACLPETYTNISPATLMRQDPPVPKHEGPNKAVH